MRDKTIIASIVLVALVIWSPSAFPQSLEFRVQFDKAKSALSQDLASPLAKLGLETTVSRIYRARVKLNLEDYEATSEFRKGFGKPYEAFRARLWEGNLEGMFANISPEDLAEMEKASTLNRESFTKFMEIARQKIRDMRNVSAEEAYRSQLYFSLILRDANRSLWQRAKKFTYIFPLCFWQR